MKNQRHAFLLMNDIAKVQSWGHDSKLEILVQKIKVLQDREKKHFQLMYSMYKSYEKCLRCYNLQFE